jgi:short-subunit dehydrogenase
MLIIYLSLICLILIIYIRIVYRKYKLHTQNYLTKNTTILLTGGCLGIGREMIKTLEKYKCKIINLDIREEFFEEIQKDNDFVTNYKCDLSKIDDIDSVFDKLKNIKIDILINNAAVAFNKPFDELSEKMLIKTMDVNLVAPMLLCKRVINTWKGMGGGHIVNIASVMSHICTSKSTAYITSKWGLYGFHECLRYGIS